MKFSKHFSKHEFYCKGNNRGICSCNTSVVDAELIIVLEDIRHHFNAVVTVYSGYRCPKYNSFVGGARLSKHKLGIASDIKVSGFSPKRLYDYLDKKYPNKYGLGLYKNFTHLDVRSNKARWGYSK